MASGDTTSIDPPDERCTWNRVRTDLVSPGVALLLLGNEDPLIDHDDLIHACWEIPASDVLRAGRDLNLEVHVRLRPFDPQLHHHPRRRSRFVPTDASIRRCG